jgi:hypothetical protein
MGDWVISILNTLISGLGATLSFIVSVLPTSPFHVLDNTPINSYLGMINWFIPVTPILTELTLFCSAVLIYYGFSIVERWIKVIE